MTGGWITVKAYWGHGNHLCDGALNLDNQVSIVRHPHEAKYEVWCRAGFKTCAIPASEIGPVFDRIYGPDAA